MMMSLSWSQSQSQLHLSFFIYTSSSLIYRIIELQKSQQQIIRFPLANKQHKISARERGTESSTIYKSYNFFTFYVSDRSDQIREREYKKTYRRNREEKMMKIYFCCCCLLLYLGKNSLAFELSTKNHFNNYLKDDGLLCVYISNANRNRKLINDVINSNFYFFSIKMMTNLLFKQFLNSTQLN